MTLIVVLLFLAGSVMAQSDSPIWKDKDGNPAPEVESQKAIDGFSGMLLVTSDKDWQEKWKTPSDHVPSFTTATNVEIGGILTTLIFFANPMADDTAEAHVLCDIRVIRPDGSFSIDAEGVDCYSGPIEGGQFNVRMAGPALGFLGEPGDQFGEYVTEVKLIDSVRQVALNLRTRFTLVEGET